MKHYLLVANWKSNKTAEEVKEWLTEFKSSLSAIPVPEHLTIVLCAAFPFLPMIREYIDRERLPLLLGAQNVSPFGKGAYTGEVNIEMVKGLINVVLIGHSERRKYFGEKEQELLQKSVLSHEAGFSVIYCVAGVRDPVPDSADYIAYEPVSAIGSGTGEDPKEANAVCAKLSEDHAGKTVCYGGSVDEKNCTEYLNQPSINGLLVGGASLDAKRFCQMIQAISSLTY